MEQEAVALHQVDELSHQLEFARRESQDRRLRRREHERRSCVRSSGRLLLSRNSTWRRPTWWRPRRHSGSP